MQCMLLSKRHSGEEREQVWGRTSTAKEYRCVPTGGFLFQSFIKAMVIFFSFLSKQQGIISIYQHIGVTFIINQNNGVYFTLNYHQVVFFVCNAMVYTHV